MQKVVLLHHDTAPTPFCCLAGKVESHGFEQCSRRVPIVAEGQSGPKILRTGFLGFLAVKNSFPGRPQEIQPSRLWTIFGWTIGLRVIVPCRMFFFSVSFWINQPCLSRRVASLCTSSAFFLGLGPWVNKSEMLIDSRGHRRMKSNIRCA